jgi:hypothetical protein
VANGGGRRRGGPRRSRPRESTGFIEVADLELLHARLIDQYAHHYSLIISIFKGVSLFAGATAVHSIFSNGATLTVKLNALALWLGSFTTLLVTYDAIMVATMVTVARPNIADVILPFLLGLAEFVEFTVLTLQAGPDASGARVQMQLSQIAWWPLVFAFATATGLVNIVNHRRQLRTSVARAAPGLREAYRWYQRNVRSDQLMTSAITALMLVAFVVLRWGAPDLRKWQGVLGLMMCAGAAASLRNAELGRRKFTEAFAALPGEVPPAAAAEPPLPVSEPSV